MSLKSSYIWASLIGQIFTLTMAVITQVFFTPGLYWWSAFFVIISACGSMGFSERMNKWDEEERRVNDEKIMLHNTNPVFRHSDIR